MSDEIKTPVLWTRDGVLQDDYVAVDTLEDIAGQAAVLLPLHLWLQLDEQQKRFKNIRIGVRIEAGEVLDNLLDDLNYIDLLVLDFPAFNDGRSFSKAARLRTHYGFSGEIRATGAVYIDQVTAMLRAGFDSLQISDPLTLSRLLNGDLHDTGVYYQPVAGGVGASEKSGERYAWRRRLA